MRWFRFWPYVLVGLVAAVASIAAAAPATFADALLRDATGGRVRIAEARGSLWHGDGRIVLADVAQSAIEGGVLAGLAVPGRIEWRIAPLPLLLARIDASIQVEGMARPVSLRGGLSELQIGEGALGFPSVDLSRMGSPWNTIRPSGALSLRWEGVTIRRGLFDGKLAIELRDTASAMSPVRPLGSYRIDVAGSGNQAAVTINTLSGPLFLQGSGSWNGRSGLRFVAEARPDASERARLESLLALIGRREGDKTVIRIGA